MRAMLLPLTGTEATTGTGDESAPSEKGAGEGFDAVLALVTAQAASPAPAPKAPAAQAALVVPSQRDNGAVVPAQAESKAKLAASMTAVAGAPQTSKRANAAADAASAGFGPWLSAQVSASELAPQAQAVALPAEQLAAEESAEPEQTERESGAAQGPSTQDPRAALPATVLMPVATVPAPVAHVAAPQAPAGVEQPAASRAPATSRAHPQRMQSAEDAGVQAAQAFQHELLAAQVQPSAQVQPPAQLQPSAAAQGDLKQASVLRAEQPQPSAQPPAPLTVSMPRAAAAKPSVAPAAPAAQLAAVQAPVAPATDAQGPTQARAAAAPAAGRAAKAPAQEPASFVSSDPRVTVQLVELGEPAQAEPALTPDGAAEAAPLAAGDEHPELQREPAGEDQQREAQAALGGGRMQPVAALQNTEVQGARGLEAVVASLLRAGNRDASVKQPTARASVQRAAQLPSIETPASAEAVATRVKLAEGAAGAQGQLADERDEREPEQREQHELMLPHAAMQPELAPRKDTPVEQAAAPMPVVPQTLDPDALLAGKPGQTGASITIDHPELGPMDLLVQSQNGRIEVRATMETPHAAQVLRAQESALRYGIQQAGMTFGALRVRTRTGDGQTVSTRDIVKRRRDHEWEA